MTNGSNNIRATEVAPKADKWLSLPKKRIPHLDRILASVRSLNKRNWLSTIPPKKNPSICKWLALKIVNREMKLWIDKNYAPVYFYHTRLKPEVFSISTALW